MVKARTVIVETNYPLDEFCGSTITFRDSKFLMDAKNNPYVILQLLNLPCIRKS